MSAQPIPFIEPSLVPSHPSGLANFETMLARVRRHWAPPLDLTVSEWARQNRFLPKGTSARPGQFIPEKFQIGMMDAINDPSVREVVIMKSTQIGYSDAVLNNIVGYYIDVDPKPLMLVQPTIDDAKNYGKKRITPMITSCVALRGKVRESKSRDGGNTLALKEFPGGFLKLVGANSGTGLRSDPVPVVLFDEVDGYPLDVDGEGDPVEIGERRTDAQNEAEIKIVKGSTPAKPKGLSRIEKAYEKSDQRRFMVACPHCSVPLFLHWSDSDPTDPRNEKRVYRLRYSLDKDGQVVKSSVLYVCEHCQKGIRESEKKTMLDAGEWIAQIPGRSVAGFLINALYSPWRENWHELCQEWHDANASKDPDELKAFVNLRLAETWEDKGSSIDEASLESRREKYPEVVGEEGLPCDVPNGVGLLTAAVDVQGDRLEVVVKGWGKDEESWLIVYLQFFGDPGLDQVWEEVDEFLQTQFRHQSGRRIKIATAFIDSGGHHTEAVYKFCRPRAPRRIFACRGGSEYGKPILANSSMNNAYRTKLWTLGTDTAKDRIFARLLISAPGPGYLHFPVEEVATDEYFEQLTAEKRLPVYKRGKGFVSEYVRKRPRNEALDLEVYNLAALYSLGQSRLRMIGELAEQLAAPNAQSSLGFDSETQAVPPHEAAKPRPSGGGWQSEGGSGWVTAW